MAKDHLEKAQGYGAFTTKLSTPPVVVFTKNKYLYILKKYNKFVILRKNNFIKKRLKWEQT